MDIAEGIRTYAHVMALAYEGNATEDDREWLRSGYKSIAAQLDIRELEFEHKQRRRLPHMVKTFWRETMTTLSEMFRAYMRGEDAGVKERQDKPQGDGTVLTTFLLNLDQREPTPEELAAAERRKVKVSAQAKAIMEALANPDSTRAHGKDHTGYTPPSER